jgi:thiamine-phosphate pyrophosphorylase
MALDPRRLLVYVVTSSGLVPGRSHRDVALAAIEGGASAVQLRAPEIADDELAPIAEELTRRCDAAGVLFVVNDRVEIAAGVGAGAHVGQDDDRLRARDAIGADAVLGISVEDVAQALDAVDAGADYLGVTVWETATKPDARPQGLHGLRAVVEAVDLPVVAIGGVDAVNARDVLDAGASGVAVVSAVGSAPDPVAATRHLVEITRGGTPA